MKQSLLILLALGLSSAAQAQNQPKSDAVMAQNQPKPDTAKKYDYFVKVPAADFDRLWQSVNEYKRLVMYDPSSKPEQKVQLFQAIEGYMKDLGSRVKLDSLKK